MLITLNLMQLIILILLNPTIILMILLLMILNLTMLVVLMILNLIMLNLIMLVRAHVRDVHEADRSHQCRFSRESKQYIDFVKIPQTNKSYNTQRMSTTIAKTFLSNL